jgi:hypothetical protein
MNYSREDVRRCVLSKLLWSVGVWEEVRDVVDETVLSPAYDTVYDSLWDFYSPVHSAVEEALREREVTG